MNERNCTGKTYLVVKVLRKTKIAFLQFPKPTLQCVEHLCESKQKQERRRQEREREKRERMTSCEDW
jgi:hypothetical protein